MGDSASVANIQNISTEAANLTQQGTVFMLEGNASAALQVWKKASKLYQTLDQDEAVSGSLLNVAIAQQGLGQYGQACNTLTQVMRLNARVCDVNQRDTLSHNNLKQSLSRTRHLTASIDALGLRLLGEVLRQTGSLENSTIVLEKALQLDAQTPASKAKTLLSYGNTQRTLYRRDQLRYQLSSAQTLEIAALNQVQDRIRTALDAYQGVINLRETPPETRLMAHINQLGLIADFLQWGKENKTNNLEVPNLQQYQSLLQQKLSSSLVAIKTANFSVIPGLLSVYAKVNVADSLSTVSQLRQTSLSPTDASLLGWAIQLTQEAQQTAGTIGNRSAESYALGTLGKLYQQTEQFTLQETALQRALALSQSVQASDISYQWQYALGQLYARDGDFKAAITAYEAAINSVTSTRKDLLQLDSDIQFRFHDQVEPIYRDYLKLLLSSPKPDLQQVVQANEQRQVVELESYLQCSLLGLETVSALAKNGSFPTTIYILELDDQIAAIVRTPDGRLHRPDRSPDSQEVQNQSENLQRILRSPDAPNISELIFQDYAQRLYEQLIRPLEPFLPQPNEPLIFVVDNAFQTTPITMLHDGDHYLIERYSIATAINAQLRPPQRLKANQFRGLIAGLSKEGPSFRDSALPAGLTALSEVKQEVKEISFKLGTSTTLLDEQFTTNAFTQQVEESSFPIIHLSTHGQFSSDPKQTYLLAWDKPINQIDIERLLRGLSDNQKSLELLVLSACETALGDHRSALGIAGIAAQAGARTTVASLWAVEDISTAELMKNFYRNLRSLNAQSPTKAEALRQAQLSLLKSEDYRHPYYWAPFIVVGSWL
jgi:CHAT domain-containing protein